MRKFRVLRFRRRKIPVRGWDQFLRIYDQIQEERRAASTKVDALIERTPVEQWPELVEDPTLRTYGAIEYLSNWFSDLLANDPQRGKALAELEISLCENLPEGKYHETTVAQGRGYAWRDLGMALRALGRLNESLDAFHAAERAIVPHSALLHDLAVVRLSMSVTLQEMRRFEEARAFIASSRKVFRQHGDDKRLVLATITEGVLLQRLRSYREAREIYLLLLNANHHIEPAVSASIHRVIGLCSIELGDYADAEISLLRSITLNQQLRQTVEAARGRAALGRLMIRRGDASRGITYLRPVRREFLQHGLIEEAGICGLEIVEGMLSLGNTTGAETLSRKIIAEYVKAGLSSRAITALGYLQEALATTGASTALVTKVREYIVSLRTAPERDFNAGA